MNEDLLLSNPPTDGISCLIFSPLYNDYLMVTSWDCNVRLYDIRRDVILNQIAFESPPLTCCFHPNQNIGFIGCVDGSVWMIDFQLGTNFKLYSHSSGVSKMVFNAIHGLLISGSWDCSLIFFNFSEKEIVVEKTCGGKVFALSSFCHRLVIATSSHQIEMYDLRDVTQPCVVKDSPLKHQIRQICYCHDRAQYIVTSIEGRVAVEALDESLDMNIYVNPQLPPPSSYSFRCHRKGDLAYPINALVYHPWGQGLFATGGCDGLVILWDGISKKKICQWGPYPSSIAGLSFSTDGTILAIASSYTFEQGESMLGKEPDRVYIHYLKESELKITPIAPLQSSTFSAFN